MNTATLNTPLQQNTPTNSLSLSAGRAVGGTFAFIVASFLVQSLSHFVLAADHFASITFMRPEPIMAMGVGTMVVQGLLLTWLFSRVGRPETLTRDALGFALSVGAFLGAYIAVVEPAKYMVPSISSWMAVEGLAATVQFVLFGLGLRLVFRN
jgi:hypothetical protein